MFYPEDFKARVKKAYPEWKELHKKLDVGEITVGFYLAASSPKGVSVEKILEATSLEELQENARDVQEKRNLYIEWTRLYQEQSS